MFKALGLLLWAEEKWKTHGWNVDAAIKMVSLLYILIQLSPTNVSDLSADVCLR